jgi:hypothetical protein
MARPTDEQMKARLMEELRNRGGYSGNIRLLGALGWSEDEYWRVRNKLIDEGVLVKGQGKGGTVRIVEEVEEAPTTTTDVVVERVVTTVVAPMAFVREESLYEPCLATLQGIGKPTRHPRWHGSAPVAGTSIISRTPSRERCQELPGRRLGFVTCAEFAHGSDPSDTTLRHSPRRAQRGERTAQGVEVHGPLHPASASAVVVLPEHPLPGAKIRALKERADPEALAAQAAEVQRVELLGHVEKGPPPVRRLDAREELSHLAGHVGHRRALAARAHVLQVQRGRERVGVGRHRGEKVRGLQRARAAQGEEVVRTPGDPRGPRAIPVLAKARVDVAAALGGLDVREAHVGAGERRPIDAPLVVRDVHAGDEPRGPRGPPPRDHGPDGGDARAHHRGEDGVAVTGERARRHGARGETR